MTKRKIYVIGGAFGYANWMNGRQTHNIEEADLVVGIGGADISPHYYNDSDSGLLWTAPYTDSFEHKYYQKAISLGKKIVGICKGMQWGTVLAGGKLFQDIDHPGGHPIQTFDGQYLLCNSLHHNMARLDDLKENEDYKLLAWANKLSPIHITGTKENLPCEKEPEVILYPKINFLGWQGHPEMMYNSPRYAEMMNWSSNLLDKFLSNGI